MKALVPLLLLAGCASWPAGSYVADVTDADAAVLAPVIAECIGAMVPSSTPVALAAPATGRALAVVLDEELTRHAVIAKPDGRPVRYVVAPFDQGMFISVAAPPGRCGEYFARVSGELTPAGSMMVAQ